MQKGPDSVKNCNSSAESYYSYLSPSPAEIQSLSLKQRTIQAGSDPWRSQVQPSAQSRVNTEFRSSCSGVYPQQVHTDYSELPNFSPCIQKWLSSRLASQGPAWSSLDCVSWHFWGQDICFSPVIRYLAAPISMTVQKWYSHHPLYLQRHPVLSHGLWWVKISQENLDLILFHYCYFLSSLNPVPMHKGTSSDWDTSN